jgi:hypothetical protein
VLVTSLKPTVNRTQLVSNFPEVGKKALWVVNSEFYLFVTVLPYQHGRKRRPLQAARVK